MDWSNRFNFGRFFVTYCTFQIPWEVIEKKGGPRGFTNLQKFTWFRNCAVLVKAGNRQENGKRERPPPLFWKGFGSNRGYGCTSKIGAICFGLFKPNRTIAPAEYSLLFLKSENHLRNPLKQWLNLFSWWIFQCWRRLAVPSVDIFRTTGLMDSTGVATEFR